MNHSDRVSSKGKKKEKTTVQMPAPMNPSHVLLGDSWRKGALTNLRPKNIPQKYADTSFMDTVAMGKKNQKSPFSVLEAYHLHWKTMSAMIEIDHIVCESWKRRRPFFNVSTKEVNTMQ